MRDEVEVLEILVEGLEWSIGGSNEGKYLLGCICLYVLTYGIE